MLSAGALSGDLLAVALQNERWRNVIQPRKGHLLELVQDNIVLNNGLMEIGYAKVLAAESSYLDCEGSLSLGTSGEVLLALDMPFHDQGVSWIETSAKPSSPQICNRY